MIDASAPSLSPPDNGEGEGETIIEVAKLWKIFGRDPKRVLQPKYAESSKEEIQEKTGCVLGLRDINIKIKKSEFYILMGLSGSGKSTLLRALIRLVNQTSGSISVLGKEITGMNEHELLNFRKKTFGMVFQHYGLFPHMTVLKNAAYGLKVRNAPKEEQHRKAMEVLETVGLTEWADYYPQNLSGGMQQRVGLARALATDPDILLMDEPFSGLDPLIRRQMQDELVELQSRLNKTIVFVTHDLHEALKLGDRIAIMRNGEIIQIGSPEEIVTNPADDYVQEFVQDASPAKVLRAGAIMSEPDVLLYSYEGPSTALTILQKEKHRGAFVVDKEGRLLGVANQERIRTTIEKKGKAERLDRMKSVIRQVPTVSPDTILEDMFAIVSQNPYPIPVVNEENRLVGVVRTDTIFEAISPSDDEEDGEEPDV